jgi:hypothetical protein
MNKIVCKMATKYWLCFRSTNFQAPALVPQGGTSRRQAKSQTISKFQSPMAETGLFRNLVPPWRDWKLFGIWDLDIGIFPPRQGLVPGMAG